MSRHQANRRRTYGRRQHEIHERHDPGVDWPSEGDERAGADRSAAVDETHQSPFGDLLAPPPWRWVTGRG